MAAPAGFGLGDFLLVRRAGANLHDRLHNFNDQYEELTAVSKQLSNLLANFEALSARVKLSGDQFAQLLRFEKKSSDLLERIDKILDKYYVQDGECAKVSKKLAWSKAAADDICREITDHINILQVFYSTISQSAVLDALEWIKLKMQAGSSRCPSVATLSQPDQDCSESDWSSIIQDLEDLGISAGMAKDHRRTILKYFENAVAHGELPEIADSTSVYSGPTCNYAEIVQQVSTWMDLRAETPTFRDIMDPIRDLSIEKGPKTDESQANSPTTAPSEQQPAGSYLYLPHQLLPSTVVPYARPRVVNVPQATYTCIFCKYLFGSKGACKRHLEDTHIAPLASKCQCLEHLEAMTGKFGGRGPIRDTQCAQGFNFSFTRQVKQRYACEYTGLCFTSASARAEALLILCDLRPFDQPQPDWHKKLLALLLMPELDPLTRSMCLERFQLFTTETSRWEDDMVFKAIDYLENAYLEGNMLMLQRGPKSTPQSNREYISNISKSTARTVRASGSDCPVSRRRFLGRWE